MPALTRPPTCAAPANPRGQVYTSEQLDITPAHRPPQSARDHVALALVTTMRRVFDYVTSYRSDRPTNEQDLLHRIVFLETVAAIPGLVGGALRHLQSLRLMRRDNGWIHTLMEEAENERMHLLTFIQLKRPGPLFRLAVIGTQGLVFNLCAARSPARRSARRCSTDSGGAAARRFFVCCAFPHRYRTWPARAR